MQQQQQHGDRVRTHRAAPTGGTPTGRMQTSRAACCRIRRHGRVCMLGVVGFLAVDGGVRFPGDVFQGMSAVEAHDTMVTTGHMWALLAAVGALEFWRFTFVGRASWHHLRKILASSPCSPRGGALGGGRSRPWPCRPPHMRHPPSAWLLTHVLASLLAWLLTHVLASLLAWRLTHVLASLLAWRLIHVLASLLAGIC